MQNSGKLAVVTGVAGGIGSALTESLLEDGFKVIAVDRDSAGYSLLKEKLKDADVEFYDADFTDSEETEKIAQKISKDFPVIDALYNVAGIGIYKNLDELSLKEWQNSIKINLDAPFVFSKYLLKNLSASLSGLIFNIGSGMGVIPSENRSAYCMSKFGLRGLSLSLSKEFKNTNVDVVLLTLGSVMTGFGTGGIELRKKLAKNGKNYLEVSEVIAKIMEITKSSQKESEYVFYPENYA